MAILILYPERRMVDEAQVIGWAKDSLCNQAASATDDRDVNEAIARDVIEATMRNHEAMTLDEAKAILEDEGSVTFGDERHEPAEFSNYQE